MLVKEVQGIEREILFVCFYKVFALLKVAMSFVLQR